MHLDEYEISLARELGLCIAFVNKSRQLLADMESRNGMTTAVFLDRWQQGTLSASPEFATWLDGVEGLQRWSEARSEYERLLKIMKI